ncbi:MAG: ribosome small subunit-dependent GTPase A [Sediminibacterium sp.]|nr:ribosome small subunit-dependent GTPase A [Sediminibacterium sp.]
MTGTVYKSTGSWYKIKGEDGIFYQGRIRGIHKLKDQLETNPVTVGDQVIYNYEGHDDQQVIIEKILDRQNHIARQSVQYKKAQQIIAANVTQSILVCSLINPQTPLGFIDRFLVSCELFHIPAIIVFNKADLMTSKEEQMYHYYKEMYQSIGYKVILVSVSQNINMDSLTELWNHKRSLISGQSGVGKSSLIKYIIPHLDLAIKGINSATGKGNHTTTFSEMFDLPNGGSIIDTPGIKELGLVNVENLELSQYFPEMLKKLSACRFNNCQHINETDCAVKDAVETGEIYIERYQNYLLMHGSIEKHFWK